MLAMATRDDVDLVVVATGGVVSLRPVLAALEAGKVVATANKETLVAGGHLVMPLASARATATRGLRDPSDPMASPLAWLRPIDSEHSAIWQCLVGERMEDVERLILTASGGPFRSHTAADLARRHARGRAGAPDLAHGRQDHHRLGDAHEQGPGGHRGALAVRCATTTRIDVVVHPQSVVHSAVEFVDGSVKAQLGHPDMRIPIQYALTYPRRVASPAPRLRWPTWPPSSSSSPTRRASRPSGSPARPGWQGRAPRPASSPPTRSPSSASWPGPSTSPASPRLVEAAVDRFGAGSPAAPDVDALIALDAEVRAWAASADSGAR